jgi:hypothetical protein
MEKVMENSLFAHNEVLKIHSEGPLYFITNQYNLREVLTGRYIGSVLSYDNKYYPDFLDICSGRVPLFTAPIGLDAAEFVKHDPETSFPVLIEVNTNQINLDGSPTFLRTTRGNGTEIAKTYCYAWAGVIPFSAITAIHFLSLQDREEFSLRAFSELPEASYLYRVSPDLVDSSFGEPALNEWLSLQSKVDVPSAADFERMDRVSGAVIICASRTKDLIDRQYIEQLGEWSKNKPSIASNRLPYWFQQGFYPKKLGRGDSPDTNSILFSAVVNVLHRFDWKASRRTLDILQSIEKELDQWSLQENERLLLGEIFDRARRYIRSEKNFEPFKPSTGYDVAKALLLFLLRPDPHQLLAWPQAETGADNNVMLTTAAFAGLLIGRKSLSIEFRPEELDKQTAQIVVQELSALTINYSAVSENVDVRAIPLEEQLTGLDVAKSIITAEQTEEVIAIQPIEDEREFISATLPVAVVESTAAKSKLSSLIKQKLMEADYTQDAKLTSFALALCKDMGWRDCVTSLLVCPGDDDVTMSQVKIKAKKVLAFKVNGFAEVIYELNALRFVELLNDLKPNDKRLLKLEKEMAT